MWRSAFLVGSMRPMIPRKFTLIDAMVLIAATGIAIVPMRQMSFERFFERGSSENLYDFGDDLYLTLIPLVVTGATALWVLRLRSPRPRLRRVFRQPGMASCTAILCYIPFHLTNWVALDFLGVFHDRFGILRFLYIIHAMPEYWVPRLSGTGSAVAAVWLVLWLGRAWNPEPSWIDRAGRVLGVYCVVGSLLFGES